MTTHDATHYEVLGVLPTATSDEIRAAYHELAARYHPDKHGGNPLADLANEKLARLNQAYEVLADPGRRAAYDAELAGRSGRPNRVFEAEAAASKRWLRILGLVVGLFVLVRIGGLLVRSIVAIGRVMGRAIALLTEEVFALRGTPFFLAIVVALFACALFLILRSRRRRHPRRHA